jgi:tetratricopeptide (TPR) repeat protein
VGSAANCTALYCTDLEFRCHDAPAREKEDVYRLSAARVYHAGSTIGIAFVLLFTLSSRLQAQSSSQQSIHQHMERAQRLLAAGEVKAAAREFQTILAIDPDNIDARTNLGVLAYFQHDCGLAIPNLKKALSQRPSLFKVQALLGLCEEQGGNSASAVHDLEQSLPHLQDWKLMKLVGSQLVEIYYRKDDLNRAANVVAELQRVHPLDVDIAFMAYRIHTELAERARDTLALVAPDSARMHQLMAEEFVHKGFAALAITQYEKALAKNPALPGLHYELGEAIMQLSTSEDTLKRAEHEFRAALAENPKNAGALAKLGRIAFSRGNTTVAEQEYRQALALQPDQPDALKGMAEISSRQGQTEQAIDYLLRASQSAPFDENIYYRLASYYRKLGRTNEANQEMAKFKKIRAIKEESSLAHQRAQQ